MTRPFNDWLECMCDTYRLGHKNSKKKGVYRVKACGYEWDDVRTLSSVRLKCCSCGREQVLYIRKRRTKVKR